MAEPFSVGVAVENPVAKRHAYARQADTGQRHPAPGWVVVGLFLPAEDGQLTCIDYRVRAIPNTHDLFGWTKTLSELAAAMEGQHPHLPAPTVTPGGIPRYVFERASQVQLLKKARETLAHSDYYQRNLSGQVRGWLASDGRRKTGRPPSRGLTEKVRILASVEAANYAGTSLDEVANRWHMSRSGLRDLLSWARNDASPRLFTNPGQGRRGGRLTPEARAMLDEIERTAE